MPHAQKAILWFRRDLRLADNPALLALTKESCDILPVFILDPRVQMGAASRCWLHDSLKALHKKLQGRLLFFKGCPEDILARLAKEQNIGRVYWNNIYEPDQGARDKKTAEKLRQAGIEVKTYNAHYLWAPGSIKKEDGTPYKVFTPFYRKGCLNGAPPGKAEDAPEIIKFIDIQAIDSLDLGTLGLYPARPWGKNMMSYWTPGEDGAQKRLRHFLDHGLKGYKDKRNRPDLDHVSRLSPYLHFGEISPRTIWHKALEAGNAQRVENDMDAFCSELGWREFSAHLLRQNPDLFEKPIQKKFEHFPWRSDAEVLERWKTGHTGIPLVDAGMRELWQTGWMHNRVRMVVASFLVKNLMLHWHEGQDWFWDCLVDADLANNAASWQWVAGCGADAAPYFRIFNPLTQAQKFDPEESYIRQFIPEYGTKDYPAPIVDLKTSRERALNTFRELPPA